MQNYREFEEFATSDGAAVTLAHNHSEFAALRDLWFEVPPRK